MAKQQPYHERSKPPRVGQAVLCADCGHAHSQHGITLQGACRVPSCSCVNFNPRCQRCGHLLDMHTWSAPGDRLQWQCLCRCERFTSVEAIQESLL